MRHVRLTTPLSGPGCLARLADVSDTDLGAHSDLMLPKGSVVVGLRRGAPVLRRTGPLSGPTAVRYRLKLVEGPVGTEVMVPTGRAALASLVRGIALGAILVGAAVLLAPVSSSLLVHDLFSGIVTGALGLWLLCGWLLVHLRAARRDETRIVELVQETLGAEAIDDLGRPAPQVPVAG